MKICSVDNCDVGVRARGFCRKHYRKYMKYGDPTKSINEPRKPCSVDGCEKLTKAKTFCPEHYGRWKNHGDPLAGRASAGLYVGCSVANCQQKHSAMGLCGLHYNRMARGNEALNSQEDLSPLQAKYHNQVQRKSIDKNGCWLSPNKPTRLGYVDVGVSGRTLRLHRVAYAATHDFDIDSKETIHHTCANRACFNPDHLQRISLRENLAEMYQRRYFQERISELELQVGELQKENQRLTLILMGY